MKQTKEDILISEAYNQVVEKKNNQLKIGKQVEKEHTKSSKKAEKIAKDHLKEDPKYYTKLKKAGL